MSHYYPPLDRCAFSRGIIHSRLGAAGRAEQGKGGMNSKEKEVRTKDEEADDSTHLNLMERGEQC